MLAKLVNFLGGRLATGLILSLAITSAGLAAYAWVVTQSAAGHRADAKLYQARLQQANAIVEQWGERFAQLERAIARVDGLIVAVEQEKAGRRAELRQSEQRLAEYIRGVIDDSACFRQPVPGPFLDFVRGGAGPGAAAGH